MKQRFMIGVLVVLALLTVGLSAQVVFAQTGTGTPAAMDSAAATGTAAAGSASMAQTFTVAAGQSVSIPANFWCLDFGKPFPTGVTGPKNQAAANVLNVLAAASQQGTVSSDPYQTQLAVWYAADGTWHDQAGQGHAAAQGLVNGAGNASPGNNSQALGTLASNGGLTVTVQSLTAVPDTANSQTPYHGTGTIVVNNTGSQSVTFTVDGAVFQPTDANAQTLVAQASSQAPTAAATVEPTATVAATVAATETMAPTVAATATAAPTETVAPTVAATATVVPTETAMVTAVPTETATAAATPATLPTTGAGDANGWMYVLLVFGALILFAGFGLGFRRASK